MGRFDIFLPFNPFAKREILRANRLMSETLRDLDRFTNTTDLDSSTQIFTPFTYRRNQAIGGRDTFFNDGDPDDNGNNTIGFF